MRKIHLAVLCVALMIVLTTTVTAEEEGGILSKIIKFIKAIISIFTGSEATTTTMATTTQPSLCTPPYIQVGRECCMDSNDNGICDSDEVTTTTTKPTTTTTRATTTTTKATTTTTTTTQPTIECYEQSDCGTSITKKECYPDGDIYWTPYTPICKNPGTPESYCYNKRGGTSIGGQITAEKAEDCPGLCDSKTNTCLS